MSDIFSQVVDPHYTIDIKEPSVPLLSPNDHDDNSHDLLTTAERSFDTTSPQSDSILIGNNKKLNGNGNKLQSV
jgi:hypothetical protein